MARFDRYLLSQLMLLFGLFSLVLVLIYWINRAVVLFDQLIADGQSVTVFLEFTALSLPGVIRIALPLSAFAAGVYVTNRMAQDSELVVLQSTGFSPARLTRPVFAFGLIVAGLMSVLAHDLVPRATAQLNDRQVDVSQNVSARLLTEGRFMEPIDGLTFYIGDITPDGELRGLFVSDIRDRTTHTIYTAAKAFLVRSDTDVSLVMIDGLGQTLRLEDQRLFTTAFEDFTYNVGGLLAVREDDSREPSELRTWELLNPSAELVAETGWRASLLLAAGHDRFAQAIVGALAAPLGFAALLLGGFSRFGAWRQVLLAIFLIVAVKAVESFGLNIARSDARFWPATYLPCLVAAAMVWILLLMASRPDLLRPRRRRRVTL